MNLIQAFKQSESLSHLAEPELQYIVDHGEVRSYTKGDYLFQAGEKADEFLFVLSGKFRIFLTQNGKTREVALLTPFEITGVLPYSRMTHAQGSAVCLEAAEVFAMHRDHFREIIVDHEPLAAALVHHMATRIRTFTKLRMQDEKLISLGKLSAGLAHELNNPAGAMVRSSEALSKHLKLLPEGFKRVMKSKLDPDVVDRVNDWLFELIEKERPRLNLAERNSREDELVEFLEKNDFEDPYELSEDLVDFGLSDEDLQKLKEQTGEDFETVLIWVVNNLNTERMVEEINTSAKRISELITSIKKYSHMDRDADRQAVDISEGLKSTLTMLRHKAKQVSVEVEESYDEPIPMISALPGELNQVWTNLIDNALDAMEEKGGTLRVTTRWDEPYVIATISDTGSGIPDEIQAQIFDPFFTTKEVGKGTGLGLDIANKIIARHKGKIDLQSKPGNTEFRISLPAVDSI